VTPPDQIKTIAADFLRALATVPGLFTRWQAETSQAARADIVRTELGLARPLSAGDVERMAAHVQPQALKAAGSNSLDGIPSLIMLSHDILPPTLIMLAHATAEGAMA
jgi:hypothetical protein